MAGNHMRDIVGGQHLAGGGLDSVHNRQLLGSLGSNQRYGQNRKNSESSSPQQEAKLAKFSCHD